MSGDTYVYIVAGLKDGWPAAPVKVGISATPEGRVASLQTASPVKLVCVQAFPVPDREAALALEKAFHVTLAKSRMSGEWFDLDPLEASLMMADNIEGMLTIAVGLEGEELETALEMTGVNWTRRKVGEAVAARDEALIRAMQ